MGRNTAFIYLKNIEMTDEETMKRLDNAIEKSVQTRIEIEKLQKMVNEKDSEITYFYSKTAGYIKFLESIVYLLTGIIVVYILFRVFNFVR